MASSRHLVAFSGAGMSTESGIPDFRSPGGIWSRHKPTMYHEFLASSEARRRYWRFYLEFFPGFARARPHQGHLALGSLFRAGRLEGVVTQNIDGLHQAAGVDPAAVVELHGNAFRTTCLDCHDYQVETSRVLERVSGGEAEPPCPRCGGRLKPATISFGQSLPSAALARASELCQGADLLLVIGSSLVVTPAADLPRLTLATGGKLAIINREPTPLDDQAVHLVRQPAGEALAAAAEAVLAVN